MACKSENKGHAQAHARVFLMWLAWALHSSQRMCVSGNQCRTRLHVTTAIQEALLPLQLQAAVAQPHPLPTPAAFPTTVALGCHFRVTATSTAPVTLSPHLQCTLLIPSTVANSSNKIGKCSQTRWPGVGCHLGGAQSLMRHIPGIVLAVRLSDLPGKVRGLG